MINLKIFKANPFVPRILVAYLFPRLLKNSTASMFILLAASSDELWIGRSIAQSPDQLITTSAFLVTNLNGREQDYLVDDDSFLLLRFVASARCRFS